MEMKFQNQRIMPKAHVPFGLQYQTTHACPNDRVLYQNENDNLEEYQWCGLYRYKRKGARNANGPPGKVLWYLSIIPRFKHLFSIKTYASNLRWHADRMKKGHLLTHIVDTSKWKTINRLHMTFEDEEHNLKVELCTDAMDPFNNFGSRHSIWLVLFVIYNFPPWLCMTYVHYAFASKLWSNTTGNDIDVYLTPFVED